jgi:hypothetical protein
MLACFEINKIMSRTFHDWCCGFLTAICFAFPFPNRYLFNLWSTPPALLVQSEFLFSEVKDLEHYCHTHFYYQTLSVH